MNQYKPSDRSPLRESWTASDIPSTSSFQNNFYSVPRPTPAPPPPLQMALELRPRTKNQPLTLDFLEDYGRILKITEEEDEPAFISAVSSPTTPAASCAFYNKYRPFEHSFPDLIGIMQFCVYRSGEKREWSSAHCLKFLGRGGTFGTPPWSASIRAVDLRTAISPHKATRSEERRLRKRKPVERGDASKLRSHRQVPLLKRKRGASNVFVLSRRALRMGGYRGVLEEKRESLLWSLEERDPALCGGCQKKRSGEKCRACWKGDLMLARWRPGVYGTKAKTKTQRWWN